MRNLINCIIATIINHFVFFMPWNHKQGRKLLSWQSSLSWNLRLCNGNKKHPGTQMFHLGHLFIFLWPIFIVNTIKNYPCPNTGKVISVSEYSGIRTQTIHTLIKTAGYWQQPNKNQTCWPMEENGVSIHSCSCPLILTKEPNTYTGVKEPTSNHFPKRIPIAQETGVIKN